MLSNWGWNVSVNLLKKIVLIRTQCTCATLRWFLAVMTGHHQQSSEIYCVHFISLCKICSVSYCEYSSLIYISFLIPIRLKTRICDCLQTGPQRRRGLSRQVRGEWAEWKARRVPRMAPWRLSTLGTSARGTLADRTPPPSRPYVGEIRIRALAIIGHLGDTYAAHGRSINSVLLRWRIAFTRDHKKYSHGTVASVVVDGATK